MGGELKKLEAIMKRNIGGKELLIKAKTRAKNRNKKRVKRLMKRHAMKPA